MGHTQGVNQSIIFNALCENYFFQVNDRIKNNTDQRQAEKIVPTALNKGWLSTSNFILTMRVNAKL